MPKTNIETGKNSVNITSNKKRKHCASFRVFLIASKHYDAYVVYSNVQTKAGLNRKSRDGAPVRVRRLPRLVM